MNTCKLTIPLYMNMDYVRLIMTNWHQTESINLSKDMLEVELTGSSRLTELLDEMWCSKSPEGSVGFIDFLQTFGAVEPNPFGRGHEGEPTLYYSLNDQTAQDLANQAAANGLTKTELLVAIKELYGDADEAIDWPPIN